jgi:cytochrome c-type biogenesis protein CcmE
MGYAVYSLFIHTGSDYITVSEARAQAESLDGQQVRIGGMVGPGSIEWDSAAQVMKFTLTDSSNRLDVLYKGVVPDSFKPGVDLVVEGKYNSDGVFEALSFGGGRSLCSFCH